TGEEGLVSSGDGEYLPRVAAWLRRRQPSGTGFAGPIRAWIDPARTDQERCLQGCHQRATEQAWRCRKPIRAALRRRGGSRLRRLLELSVLPCLAGVYADFMLCYMACKTEHLY
ncbi:MAG TPA: hypothetical protein VLH79_08775, partial [Chthonomonadales bacterium]|nr:hypothetical protein [Chthonomonadales bacterium]